MEIQSLIRAVSAILVVAATGAIVMIVAMPGTHVGKAGQILVSKRVHGRIEQHVVAEPLGELALKGFHRNVQAFNVTGLKPA